MQLGLFTMPLHPPGTNFTETLKADLDQIVKLDELGYAEVWIGEHFTSEWENIPAPECARRTGASVAGESPVGRRRLATTSTPSHGPPSARMEVKR